MSHNDCLVKLQIQYPGTQDIVDCYVNWLSVDACYKIPGMGDEFVELRIKGDSFKARLGGATGIPQLDDFQGIE